MARRTKWVAWGLVAALIGVGLSAVVAFGWWLWPTLEHLSGDPISAAGFRTERKLLLYERTHRPDDLRVWLTTYHGDASDQQVVVMLAEWSVRHQQQFLKLAEGIVDQKEAMFASRFASALSESGQTAAFRSAFHSYRSPALKAVDWQLRHGIR